MTPLASKNGLGNYESKTFTKGDTAANQFINSQGNGKRFFVQRLLQRFGLFCSISLTSILTGSVPALAGIENMMSNLQSAILNVLAPMICVGGIIFAGFKLAMGDESAKRMLWWSCIGTVITFTAPSILSFLQTRVAS